MPSVPHAWAVWRRNATMYRRSWLVTILPNFFEPVLYLLSLGLGVGAYINEMSGLSYLAFLAPGLICVSAMNGASFEVTYNVFVRMSYQKTYDGMLTTPLSPEDILLGEVLWAVTRAVIYGGCFLAVVLAWGLVPPAGALLMLPVLPLTGLLFAAIGIAFSVRISVIELFSFYFTLFLTPIFLFSDVFFPLAERLPARWWWIAELFPLLHPVRLARHVFSGTWSAVLLWDVGYVLIVSTALLSWAAVWVRRRLTS